MAKVEIGLLYVKEHKRSYYIKIPKCRWPPIGIKKGDDLIFRILSKNRIQMETLNPENLSTLANAVIKYKKQVQTRKVGILGKDLVVCIPKDMIRKLKMRDYSLFKISWLKGQRYLLEKLPL